MSSQRNVIEQGIITISSQHFIYFYYSNSNVRNLLSVSDWIVLTGCLTNVTVRVARGCACASKHSTRGKTKTQHSEPFRHSSCVGLTEQMLQVPLAVVVAARTGEEASLSTYKVEGVHQVGATQVLCGCRWAAVSTEQQEQQHRCCP